MEKIKQDIQKRSAQYQDADAPQDQQLYIQGAESMFPTMQDVAVKFTIWADTYRIGSNLYYNPNKIKGSLVDTLWIYNHFLNNVYEKQD